MITIFGVQTKVTYCKNIFKFRETWSFSKWFIPQTNIHTDRQTNFTLSHGNKLAMVSKWKGGLYNNNKNIYIYIQIGAFVQKLPAIERIARTKIPDFF